MEAVVPGSYRGPCTALCFEADAVWWGTGPVLACLPVPAATIAAAAAASEDAAALRRRARVLPPGEVMHGVCAAMGCGGAAAAAPSSASSSSLSAPSVLAVGSHNVALVSAGAAVAAAPLEVRAALRVAVPIATGGAAWYVPSSGAEGADAAVVVAVLTLDSFVTVFGVATAGGAAGAAPRVLLRAGMGLGSVGCMSGAFALRRGVGAAALSVYAGGMGGRVWGQTYTVVGGTAAAAPAAAPVALDGHASTGHVRAVAAQTLRCGTTYVATACDDRSVALWRLPLPAEGTAAAAGAGEAKAVAVCCVKGAHAARVWTVALAFPYLASGGEDGVVCLRRVMAGEGSSGGGDSGTTLLASHRADSGSWAAALRSSSDAGTSADLAFGSLSGDVRVVLGGGGSTPAALGPSSQTTSLLCPLRQQLPRGSAAVRVARCSSGGGGGAPSLCYAASGDVLYAMRMGGPDEGQEEESSATPVCHFGGAGGGSVDGATCVASAERNVAVGTAGGLLHIACVETAATPAAAVTPRVTLRVGRKVLAASMVSTTATVAVASAASAGGDVVVCEVARAGGGAGRCWRFAPADAASAVPTPPTNPCAGAEAAAGGKRRRVGGGGGGGGIPTAVWGTAGGDGSWALAIVGFKDGTLRFFVGRGEGGGGGDGVLTASSDVAERLAEGDSGPIVSIVHNTAGGTVVVAGEGGAVAVYDVSSSSAGAGAPPSRVSLVRTGFKDLVGAAQQQLLQGSSAAAAAPLLLLRFHAGRFSLSDAARGGDELDGAGVRGGSKAVSRRTLGVAWGGLTAGGGGGGGVGAAATTVGVSCVQESKEVMAAVLVAPGGGGGGGGGGATTTGGGVSAEDGVFLRCDVEGMSVEAAADGVFVAGGDDGSAVCIQPGGDGCAPSPSSSSSSPPRVSRVLLPRHTSVVKAAAACVLRFGGGGGCPPRPVYAACGGNEQLSVWAADDGGGVGGTGAGGLLFSHAPDANDETATLQRLLCLGRLREDALVAGASDGTLRVFAFSSAPPVAVEVVAVEASPPFGSCLSLACFGGVVVVDGSCGRVAVVRVGATASDSATLALYRPHQVGANCLSVRATASADAVLRVVSGGDDQTVAVWDVPVGGGVPSSPPPPPPPRRVAEAAVFSAGARAVRWAEGGGGGGGVDRFVALGSDQRVVLCGVEDGGALRVVCGVVTSVLRPTSLAVQVAEGEEEDGCGGGALRVVVAGKGCEVLKMGCLRRPSRE